MIEREGERSRRSIVISSSSVFFCYGFGNVFLVIIVILEVILWKFVVVLLCYFLWREGGRKRVS